MKCGNFRAVLTFSEFCLESERFSTQKMFWKRGLLTCISSMCSLGFFLAFSSVFSALNLPMCGHRVVFEGLSIDFATVSLAWFLCLQICFYKMPCCITASKSRDIILSKSILCAKVWILLSATKLVNSLPQFRSLVWSIMFSLYNRY